ncbi:MAG: DUF3467 domain-containing protein [Bacteroidota bacterium]
MEDPKNQNQLNIEVPEDIAEGVYSNFAIVGHSPTEFVLDFVQVLPGMSKGKVRSRVVVTPQHARRLLAALSENVDKYEAAFGRIELNGPSFPPTPPSYGGGPAGIA